MVWTDEAYAVGCCFKAVTLRNVEVEKMQEKKTISLQGRL